MGRALCCNGLSRDGSKSRLLTGPNALKRNYFIIILSAVTACIVAVFAVCLHSLEEIHYLKSFFPAQFTVEAAFYAGAVEIIKIAIISLPLILVIGVGLFLLYYFKDSC